jgi:formate hydrogenlyase subunit 6/NADH:ubiquinone oxidoreductase subunit I
MIQITDDCMSCGMCADECRAGAISPGKRRGSAYAKYEINQDLCIECGNCIDICPANAIIEKGETE